MTREEFMDIVYDELHSDGDNYRANRIIDAADEYAEEQTRWIPVSEGLPETNEEAYSDDVLLSLSETYRDVSTTIGCYDEAALSSDGRYMDTEGWVLKSGMRIPLSDVTAWRLLPQPYKAESEDSNASSN